jgi:hypothetical protein
VPQAAGVIRLERQNLLTMVFRLRALAGAVEGKGFPQCLFDIHGWEQGYAGMPPSDHLH